jgi:hypothetical protein
MYSGINGASLKKLKFPYLRVLNLLNTISWREIDYIAQNFPNLDTLGINGLQGDYVEKLQNLQILVTEGITDDSLPCLQKLNKLRILLGIDKGKLDRVTHLKDLWVVDGVYSDEDISYLHNFPQLRKFSPQFDDDYGYLSNKNISDHGLKLLQNIPHLSTLDLENNKKITNNGLRHLKQLKNLKVLNLENTNIDDVGLEHLKDFTHLYALNLGSTQITDKGLAYLAHLHNLWELNLKYTKITSDGLVHLEDLVNLRVIILYGTKLHNWGNLELLPKIRTIRGP